MDDEAVIASLAENVQRGDISEEEIAIAYTTLDKVNPKRWTEKAIAKKAGKSQQWFADILAAYRTAVKLEQNGLIKKR